MKSMAEYTKLLQAEMKELKSRLDDSSKSSDKNADEMKNLREQYKTSQSVVSKLEEQIAKLEETMGDGSQATEQQKSTLIKLKTALADARTNSNNLSRGITGIGESSTTSAGMVNTLKTSLTAANAALGPIGIAIAAVITILEAFKSTVDKVTDAIKNMATGMYNITKSVVTTYSEFEQAAGGIEAKWGEFPDLLNKIKTDAANAFRTVNKSQTEYMNDFMKLSSVVSSSISDQNAQYEVTTKLLKISSDLWSRYGGEAETYLTAITNAMKGQYQQLDNLNIGIKGTNKGLVEAANKCGLFNKTIKDATELTAEEIALIIEYYTEASGALNATADESATTIAGSLATLQAAWENLKIAFGTGEGIDQALDNIVVSVETFVDNVAVVVSRFGEALSEHGDEIGESIATLINKLLPIVMKVATDLMIGFAEALAGASSEISANPGVYTAFTNAFIDLIRTVVNKLAPILKTAFNDVLNNIKLNAPVLYRACVTVYNGFVLIDWIIRSLAIAVLAVAAGIAAILDPINTIKGDSFATKIWDEVESLAGTYPEFKSWSTAIEDENSELSDSFGGVSEKIEGIGTSMENTASTAYDSGSKTIGEYAKGLNDNKGLIDIAISETSTDIEEQFSDIKTEAYKSGSFTSAAYSEGFINGELSIKNAVSNSKTAVTNELDLASDDALSAGENVASKFASGMESKDNEITSQISSIINNVKSLDVSSESYTWGCDIATSLSNGMYANANLVAQAANYLASIIRARLHFSEPDEGPLSNFHTYAPDMMKLFAKGILDNQHVVTNALDTAFNFGSAFDAFSNAAYASSSATYNYGGVSLNVYASEGQSASDIADEVMDRIQSAVNSREAMFA